MGNTIFNQIVKVVFITLLGFGPESLFSGTVLNQPHSLVQI